VSLPHLVEFLACFHSLQAFLLFSFLRLDMGPGLVANLMACTSHALGFSFFLIIVLNLLHKYTTLSRPGHSYKIKAIPKSAIP
jgi:hypothetical protein